MRNIMFAVAFVLVSFAATAAMAQEIATVELVSVGGTGCKKDDFVIALADDKTAFTISYTNYTAAAGTGAKPQESRKNCNLNVKVKVPNGFTYGIAGADMRGYANLAPGANGLAKVSFWFQGNPMTGFINHNIRESSFSFPGSYVDGQFDDNWETSDQTQFAAIVWASCSAQRNLNVNTELRATAPASAPYSWVTEDTTDISLTTVFHLAFQPCP
jgi:uncharacterized protein DUF4360